MRTVQLRDAKATLSALVDAAERGESTTITRHGKPVAVLMPVEEASVAEPVEPKKPNLVEYLMTFPGGIDFDRDEESTLRSVDL